MSLQPKSDLGSHVVGLDANSSENSGAPALIVAGGGLDNVKVTGQVIDRFQGSSTQGKAESMTVVTQFLAALADTETVALAHELEESDDGSAFDAPEVIEALTVKATASGAENKRGQAEFDIDMRNRKQFVRYNVTLDLSRGATDTASFATVATLGGFDILPQ